MRAIERALRTLEQQLPDRVPVDLHNFMVTARMMGVTSFGDLFRDDEAMAEGQLMAWRRFGHDVLLVENGTAVLPALGRFSARPDCGQLWASVC